MQLISEMGYDPNFAKLAQQAGYTFRDSGYFTPNQIAQYENIPANYRTNTMQGGLSQAQLQTKLQDQQMRSANSQQQQYAINQQTNLAGQQTPITPGMLNPGQVTPISPPTFSPASLNRAPIATPGQISPRVQTYSPPNAPRVQTYSPSNAPRVQTYSPPNAPIAQTYSSPNAPRYGSQERAQENRRVSTEDFDRQQRLGQTQANTATTDALNASRNVADPGRSVYDTRLQQMMTGGFTPDDPSYQWRMNQGMENLSRASAARGMLGSGNILAELTDYAQGAASQEYGAQFNRLLSASQNATQQYSTAYNTLGQMLGQQQGQQQLGLAGNQFKLAQEAQIDSRQQFRNQLGLDYNRLGLGYNQLNAQQGFNYAQLNSQQRLNYDQLNAQQGFNYDQLNAQQGLNYAQLNAQQGLSYDQLNAQQGFNYDQLNAQQGLSYDQLNAQQGLNYAQLNAQQDLSYDQLRAQQGFNYAQLASQQGVNYGELNLRRQAQADSTALDRAQFLQQGNQFGQDQAQDWARIAQGWGNQALGFYAGDTNAYNASVNAGQLALERNRFNANETRLNNYDQGIGAGLMAGAGVFGG